MRLAENKQSEVSPFHLKVEGIIRFGIPYGIHRLIKKSPGFLKSRGCKQAINSNAFRKKESAC